MQSFFEAKLTHLIALFSFDLSLSVFYFFLQPSAMGESRETELHPARQAGEKEFLVLLATFPSKEELVEKG